MENSPVHFFSEIVVTINVPLCSIICLDSSLYNCFRKKKIKGKE